MTAMVTTQQHNNGGLLLAVLLSAAITAGLLLYKVHDADLKHGPEAEDIRRCLEDKGPFMVFASRDKSTFYFLCEISKGVWGVQARAKDGGERTVFIPKDGSWKEVVKYLERFATKYKGKLPWIP